MPKPKMTKSRWRRTVRRLRGKGFTDEQIKAEFTKHLDI